MKKSLLIAALIIGVIVQANAQLVVADQCEDLKGWSGKTPVILSQDAKEGKHSLQSEGVGDFRFRKVFENPVNVRIDGKNGYISFWLFVSDAKALERTPGVLQISSSGKAELNSYQLKLKDIIFQNGWNNVVLDLNEESSKGGNFDGSHFNYFNLIQKTDSPVTLKIDNIRFGKKIQKI